MWSQDINWQNGTNEAACQALTDCPATWFVSVAATRSTDRACAPCPEETWSVAVNAARCTAATVCRPGTYISVNLTVTADRECLPCVAGANFTSTANELECAPVRLCSVLEEQSDPPTAARNRFCALPSTASFASSSLGAGIIAALVGIILVAVLLVIRIRRRRHALTSMRSEAAALSTASVAMSANPLYRPSDDDGDARFSTGSTGEFVLYSVPSARPRTLTLFANPLYETDTESGAEAYQIPVDEGSIGDGAESGAPVTQYSIPLDRLERRRTVYQVPMAGDDADMALPGATSSVYALAGPGGQAHDQRVKVMDGDVGDVDADADDTGEWGWSADDMAAGEAMKRGQATGNTVVRRGGAERARTLTSSTDRPTFLGIYEPVHSPEHAASLRAGT